MRTTTTSAALVLLATIGLAAGCTQETRGEPVATRPSLTIFPVQMAGEPRPDVARFVALLLEQRGMESIEVDDTGFSPAAEASYDEQVAAFAAFVKARGVSTEYALYGAVIGSPQRGVDEIDAVLVDRSGKVAWSDRQTRESRAMKRSKPSDPMSSTLFLVDRLRDPLDLLDPSQVDDSGGKWAREAKAESLAPPDAERDEMDRRLARLREAAPAATVLVYPARAGDSWCVECAHRIADEINRRRLLDASVAETPLQFQIQPSHNEQRVLWSGARSIRQLVRANPRHADYVLFADYLLPGGGGEAVGVHTFLLESDGDWVIVDYQNSHHDDFKKIRPTTLDGCCDLSVVRLEGYLGKGR